MCDGNRGVATGHDLHIVLHSVCNRGDDTHDVLLVSQELLDSRLEGTAGRWVLGFGKQEKHQLQLSEGFHR